MRLTPTHMLYTLELANSGTVLCVCVCVCHVVWRDFPMSVCVHYEGIFVNCILMWGRYWMIAMNIFSLLNHDKNFGQKQTCYNMIANRKDVK